MGWRGARWVQKNEKGLAQVFQAWRWGASLQGSYGEGEAQEGGPIPGGVEVQVPGLQTNTDTPVTYEHSLTRYMP